MDLDSWLAEHIGCEQRRADVRANVDCLSDFRVASLEDLEDALGLAELANHGPCAELPRGSGRSWQGCGCVGRRPDAPKRYRFWVQKSFPDSARRRL